ncbi:MAG: D-alanyl-D-alanine carboxypeptidase family protein [Cellulosilyticaceae bacterium]
MFKKFSLLFCSFFLFTIVLYAGPTPQISSEGAILIEPTTGKILYSKNANERFFPASTTKILSTLILIEDLNPQELITKSAQAIKDVPSDSSHIGLSQNDAYLAIDGFHAILMASDNFVAYDMAIKDAGTMSNFIGKMNAKAKALGATNSNFVNPHGYHDPNHYTTPYDLAKIAIGAFSNPNFAKVAGTHQYDFKTKNTNKNFSLTHTAPLLEQGSDLYNSHVIGAKTGFHDAAKRTLVAKAHYDNINLIAVVMRTSNPNQFIDINKLFDYGSTNFTTIKDSSGMLTLANHSYSSWAKYYVDYALSMNWIAPSVQNYSDPISKEDLIALLVNAVPSHYSGILNQQLNFPGTNVTKDSLPISRGDTALTLSQIIYTLNLKPFEYYAKTNIPDIQGKPANMQKAINFTASAKLFGDPVSSFSPDTYLTYEQALAITYNFEHIFRTSLPQVFTHN